MGLTTHGKVGGWAAVILLISAVSAAGQDYKISRITYDNNGAYKACVHVKWKTADGTKLQEDHRKSVCANAGRKETRRLENVVGKNGETIQAGDEVWAEIDIKAGEIENCRKDGKTFFYDPAGGTVTYKTGGTTYNDNRCKIKSTP
jgi:hypothetical protein